MPVSSRSPGWQLLPPRPATSPLCRCGSRVLHAPSPLGPCGVRTRGCRALESLFGEWGQRGDKPGSDQRLGSPSSGATGVFSFRCAVRPRCGAPNSTLLRCVYIPIAVAAKRLACGVVVLPASERQSVCAVGSRGASCQLREGTDALPRLSRVTAIQGKEMVPPSNRALSMPDLQMGARWQPWFKGTSRIRLLILRPIGLWFIQGTCPDSGQAPLGLCCLGGPAQSWLWHPCETCQPLASGFQFIQKKKTNPQIL